jgi:periplasmic divalent cation tolerance protein
METETGYCQVSTATNSPEAAAESARSAVEARLAACAQVIGPIRSLYWWDGRVNDETEWLVLFKTTTADADALVEHLLSGHSYEVPEVVVTPVIGGNPAYLAWIREETR